MLMVSFQASYGSACSSIECTLESLLERKRLLEFSYQNRKQKLEHVLKIREWEDEVDQVTKRWDFCNWFAWMCMV